MNRTTLNFGFVAWAAMACGMDTTVSDVKLAGVGLDPDEIGSSPDYHGGLVEYNLVDFAGAQLPLGLVGLVSYEQVGPDVNFRPPYKMVLGQGFMFQDDMQAPDAAMGTLAKPPSAEGVCQTRFEPRSYLSGLADVGDHISFKTKGGDGGFTIGRRPYVYPTDMRDVIAYYMELDAWRADHRTRPVLYDPTDSTPTNMVEETFIPANFPEGELVELDFPGGIPPMEAGMGAIPLPLRAAKSSRGIVLPNSPAGVRIGWDGPRYDRFGRLMEAPSVEDMGQGDTGAFEIEENSTCLQYVPHSSVPMTSEDCLELADIPNSPAEYAELGLNYSARELNGQMYTGPWDTEDQKVVFEWIPGAEDSGEIVTLTVRFLGPVDTEDENMVEGVVMNTTPANRAEDAWEEAIDAGDVPSGTELPVGRRAALACDQPYDMGDPATLRDQESEIEWPLEQAFQYENGDFVPSLHGDPGHNLAEVPCRLTDADVRFELTQDIVEKAMDYAALHGAEGAVFYLSRSSETEIQGPPVRDRFGKRHNTSPVKVVARSMQIGRFWFGE